MFQYTPPPMLRFYHQPGCAACATAEPHLANFMRRHPTLTVLKLNVAARDYEFQEQEIHATPTYLLTAGRELLKKHVGTLTASQLEAFVRGAA